MEHNFTFYFYFLNKMENFNPQMVKEYNQVKLISFIFVFNFLNIMNLIKILNY